MHCGNKKEFTVTNLKIYFSPKWAWEINISVVVAKLLKSFMALGNYGSICGQQLAGICPPPPEKETNVTDMFERYENSSERAQATL